MKLPPRIALALLCLAALLGASCSREAKDARHRERADEFFAEAKYDRAELEYLNVLKAKPGDVHAIARLGQIYFAQGQLGRAFPLLAHARQHAPDDLDNRLALGELNLAAGRRQESLDEAIHVLEKRPTDARAILLLGDAAALPPQIEAAKNALAGLPAEAAQTAPALAARAMLTAREGDATAAAALFQQAAERDPRLPHAHSGLALIALSRGDVRAADAALAKAAEVAGPRDRQRLAYAAFKLQLGDRAAGRQLLERITQEAPDFVPALLRQVDLAGAEGRLDEAAALLDQVRGRDPNNPEVLLAAGRLALASRDPAKALIEFEKLTSLFPQLAPAHFETARAHVANLDLEKAVESLNRALQLTPDYPEATLMLATIDLQRGKRSSAIVALRQLVTKRPGLVEGQILLAEAYRAQGEPELALGILDTLHANAPSNDRIALLRGNVLVQSRRFDDARAVFEAVLKRTPANAAAIEQLTGMDVAAKRFDAARQRLEEAFRTAPQMAELRVISAQLHFSQQQPTEAETELRRAIELNPSLMVAYGLLARYYLTAGDPEKALSSLGEVVKRNPRDEGAWMLAAQIHEQRSDWPRAREAYERLLEVSPRFGLALNNLAVLLSERFGEPDRALEMARTAREVRPTDPNVADTLGWILYKRGEFATAARLLRESAERLPDSAEVRFHLGMTEYALGDEASRKTLEDALSREPGAAWTTEAERSLAILRLTPPADAAARALIDAALKARPDDVIALDRKAAIEESEGANEAALATRQRLATLAPQNPRAILALARLTLKAGDREKALSLARDARRLAPQDLEVAALLGRLALDSKDYVWAIGLLREVARRQTDNAPVHIDLGVAALAVGRADEAIDAWKRALTLDPKSPRLTEVRDSLILVEAARAGKPTPATVSLANRRLETGGNDLAALIFMVAASPTTEEKVRLWERLLVEYPEYLPARRELLLQLARDPAADARTLTLAAAARDAFTGDRDVSRALGIVHHRTSDHRRAVSLLEAAVRLGSTDGETHFFLGRSQIGLGQTEAGKTSLRLALDQGLPPALAEQARKDLQ